MYANHFAPQLKHCWLRNVNKHTLKAGQGAPGMGHSMPCSQHHLQKWRMAHSSGASIPRCPTAVQGITRSHGTTCCLVRKACQGNSSQSAQRLPGQNPLALLPPLSKPCLCRRTVSQQLCTRLTYASQNPLAQTFGWTFGLAWLNLTEAYPTNWRAWNRKNAENMG